MAPHFRLLSGAPAIDTPGDLSTIADARSCIAESLAVEATRITLLHGEVELDNDADYNLLPTCDVITVLVLRDPLETELANAVGCDAFEELLQWKELTLQALDDPADLTFDLLLDQEEELGHMHQSSQLAKLPDNIRMLRELERLAVTFHALEEFPKGVLGLPNLHTLDLRGNRLRSLPADISMMTSLRTLLLADNFLTAVPETMGLLSQLEELHLSNNQLEVLPGNFHHLRSLRSLSLDGNHLSKLPECFGELTSLTELHLEENPIEELPASFMSLHELVELHMPLSVKFGCACPQLPRAAPPRERVAYRCTWWVIKWRQRRSWAEPANLSNL